MGHKIHPTAVVDPSAELAEGVVIGPLAIIGARVSLGEDTEVAGHAHVQGPSRIGARNVVYSHACVGFDPQDLKYKGEETWLEVGDDNRIREFVTLNRGTRSGGGRTVIGDDNLFMTGAHVGHDCQVGSRIVFANNGTLAGHVSVENDATIGAFNSVHQFCRIGRHAYLGGYTVATLDALPFSITVGQKPVWMSVNKIGLGRKGFSQEEIQELQNAFRILLRSKLNTTQALERLKQEFPSSANVQYLIAFVEGSERGFCKRGRKGTRGE